jgi:hypothetical protein
MLCYTVFEPITGREEASRLDATATATTKV